MMRKTKEGPRRGRLEDEDVEIDGVRCDQDVGPEDPVEGLEGQQMFCNKVKEQD